MRKPGPEGFGRRMARVRARFGSRGEWTSQRRFAADLGIDPARYRSWEAQNRFPGIQQLSDLLDKVEAVRAIGDQPKFACSRVAYWAAFGPDDSPPWKPAALDVISIARNGDDPSPPAGRGSAKGVERVTIPAMPLTLLRDVTALVLDVGARELKDAKGRGNLAHVEIATAFEKWLRENPELRAHIASGLSSTEDRGSNLLQWPARPAKLVRPDRRPDGSVPQHRRIAATA